MEDSSLMEGVIKVLLACLQLGGYFHINKNWLHIQDVYLQGSVKTFSFGNGTPYCIFEYSMKMLCFLLSLFQMECLLSPHLTRNCTYLLSSDSEFYNFKYSNEVYDSKRNGLMRQIVL